MSPFIQWWCHSTYQSTHCTSYIIVINHYWLVLLILAERTVLLNCGIVAPWFNSFGQMVEFICGGDWCCTTGTTSVSFPYLQLYGVGSFGVWKIPLVKLEFVLRGVTGTDRVDFMLAIFPAGDVLLQQENATFYQVR